MQALLKPLATKFHKDRVIFWYSYPNFFIKYVFIQEIYQDIAALTPNIDH